MKYLATNTLSLFETLVKLAPESSKTTLRSWIKEGRITINGDIVKKGSCLVRPGQTVALGAKKCNIKGLFQILFEDSHIVVIDKPSGLLSVATANERERTVHSFLKERYRKVYVVHRLDRDTSGVMLFALSEEAYDRLDTLFEKHEIKRSYTGIVEGKLEASSGKWESYLYEDEQYLVHSSPIAGQGKRAITHFEVKNFSQMFSFVLFTLETGKKNQIRVHCQDAGHPIAGDKKYGAITDPIKRLCLHAHLLSFLHPITQKPLTFISPPPREFDFRN